MKIVNDTFIHFSWENSGNYNNMMHCINSKKVSRVVIFGPQEHTVIHYDDDLRKSKLFDNFLKKKNIEIIRVVGSPVSKKWNPLYPMLHKKRVYSWETFFANLVVYDSLSKNEIILPSGHTTIKKHFLSLNRKPHPHRCMFIDLMHKHNIQDNGSITWHSYECTEYPYKFKFWNPKILEIPEPNLDLTNLMLSDPHPSFQETLFSVVCESTEDLIFCTEKTYVPIYHKRPFIIFGAKNIHLYLKKMNFKLFDEVIDYSFDSVDDPHKRFELAMLQLKKICEMDPYEILTKVKPKIDYNYVNLLNIFKDAQTYLDPIVFDLTTYDVPNMDRYRNMLTYGQTTEFENLYKNLI